MSPPISDEVSRLVHSLFEGRSLLAASGETADTGARQRVSQKRQGLPLAGRITIEKDREIVTGILHATANFWNRVHRKSVENSLDTFTIDLSMNAREVAEANRHYSANPRRRVPGESQALRLHPSPIWVV